MSGEPYGASQLTIHGPNLMYKEGIDAMRFCYLMTLKEKYGMFFESEFIFDRDYVLWPLKGGALQVPLQGFTFTKKFNKKKIFNRVKRFLRERKLYG